MIPRERGRRDTSNRGSQSPLIQKGINRLIAESIASSSILSNTPKKDNLLYEEFIQFMKEKKGKSISSYAHVVTAEEDSEESLPFEQNSYKKIILLLENKIS